MLLDKYQSPRPPRKGEKLFCGDPRDRMNNACLRQGDDYAYREGYRRGAQLLVNAVTAAARRQD